MIKKPAIPNLGLDGGVALGAQQQLQHLAVGHAQRRVGRRRQRDLLRHQPVVVLGAAEAEHRLARVVGEVPGRGSEALWELLRLCRADAVGEEKVDGRHVVAEAAVQALELF